MKQIVYALLFTASVTGCAAERASPQVVEQRAAQAEETRVVFSSLLCAYSDVRERASTAHAKQLDEEIDRLHRTFRQMEAEPRPCSEPLIERLTACVDITFQEGDVVSEWRSDRECSSGELARYVN